MKSMFCCCLVASVAVLSVSSVFAAENDYHPLIDPEKPQYMIGYGSLMESASKHATEPNAFKIDGYLNRLLPGIVKEIRIA